MQTANKLDMTERSDEQISYSFFFFMSFLIWLIATVVMRIWGHTFFIPDSNLSMIGSFLFSLVFLPVLAAAIFRWQKVQPDQRRDAAICLSIPGMLLDVVITYFFVQAYPNMLPTADGAYGSWLLWGYAIVLVTGLVTSQSHTSRSI